MANKDLTGQRFTRLVALAIDPSPRRPRDCIKWRCRCDCGNETVVSGTKLRTGWSKSCGCLQKEKAASSCRTHGLSKLEGKKQRLYTIWIGMRRRCNNAAKWSSDYSRYGGRGIKVCPEWNGSFGTFHAWAISAGYADGLTIERLDNEKGYCPDNCTWVTLGQQASNKRNSKRLEYQGKVGTIAQHALATGVGVGALAARLRKGQAIADAISDLQAYEARKLQRSTNIPV